MRTALFVWRAHRRSWRAVWSLALAVSLLGALTLASFAGARRTASTFAAYQRDVKLSDVAVNTFTPDLQRVDAIAHLPGVRSSATYVGLDAFPVVRGRVVDDFRYTGVFGSLDGRFFTQDRATVVDGRLPRTDALDEVALSSGVTRRLGKHVGDRITYEFGDPSQLDDPGAPDGDRTTYRVVGIVRLPPVVVDENDIIEGAVLPPAATRAHLDSRVYSWQGILLVDGTRGVTDFVHRLQSDPSVNGLPPVVQRSDEIRVQAQRSIRPQAVALVVFGIAAALAALALGGFGISRLVRRWSGAQLAFRVVGLTHRERALIVGLDAAVGLGIGVVVAVALAVALSPLWPLGQLRDIAPDTGIDIDLTIMLGAASVLMLALFAMSAFAAWRASSSGSHGGVPARPSRVVATASRVGAPLPAVLGAHFAFDPGQDGSSVPVRVTVLAGALATLAVVAALVFGSSLRGLVDHPVRYGWAWDRMMVAEAGYGRLDAATVTRVIDRGDDVDAWSLLAFDEVTIDEERVPVLGVDRHAGNVEPPVLTGHAVRGSNQIVLGQNTLDDLGRHVGDRVRVGFDGHHAKLRIVGTSTLPSIGRGGADHTSLGRGALMTYATLADLVAPSTSCNQTNDAECPGAVVFDVRPGADGARVAARLAAANPDGTPGGTYEQPLTRAADIRNYDEMGLLPVALAALLAGGAIFALVATLFAAQRVRRRDLAILKTMGLAVSQIRATLLAQALMTVAITLTVGIPLGIVAGRLTWSYFAHDIGVLPDPTVPVLTIVGIAAGTAALCALVSLLPSAALSRTPPARVLRTE